MFFLFAGIVGLVIMLGRHLDQRLNLIEAKLNQINETVERAAAAASQTLTRSYSRD